VTGSSSVVVKRSVERELRAVPKADLDRLVRRIRSLAEDPRPPGSETLSGQDRYRVRQGDYRVVYAVDDERIVEIVKIGHRREVYRN
jgi:mRNA interferase RelE/StbE